MLSAVHLYCCCCCIQTKDGWTVKDHQGNTAKVVKAEIKKGNHTIHVIDRVLMSGAFNIETSQVKIN
jgi:uncharacterized surface protein with fasciclin (FAS1) repeats